jgi:hypothetical protein
VSKIFKISGYYVDPNGDFDAERVKIFLEEDLDVIAHHIRVEEVDLPGEWDDDNPLNRCDCSVAECEKYFRGGVSMDYREMWERLKEEVEMAFEEGLDCGYDDPESENFDKFYVYERIYRKMNALEVNKKEM